jgi:phosphoinositide-3-kinase regulatory subunit 4
MDIFSAGCVVMETFLNGERALDLGDLMEYRRKRSLTTSMQQGLGKIESSSLRAACRHMLHLDPTERLSAKDYRDRLQDVIPSTFDDIFMPLFERITCHEVTPDARMAVAASYYGKVLRGTVGVVDGEGEMYFQKMLGPTMSRLEAGDEEKDDNEKDLKALSDIGNRMSPEDSLLAETEALLKKLESPSFDEDDDEPLSMISILPTKISPKIKASPPSPEAANSLLIYLQLILSTVRNVQRPSSKLVGLQLLERLGTFSSDDSKLQRIVPTAVSLLHDQDPLVRASAVQVMTSTLSTIKTFAPSDSKIFPQYIFKRVAHLISDPSLVVRVAFARCIASLADTAHRFLDITHAVRLYEAVGGGNGSEGTDFKGEGSLTPGVFTDDVANLLDGKAKDGKSGESADEADSASNDPRHSRKSGIGNASVTTSTVGRTLISSTYTSELAALHEIVSRWVVHIATDQSDQSSPPKRSLLCDLARLCNFFGRDGVMAFILPQILAFLNDRRDWQLRAALFERLPSVCSIIGRAATEHFVLPCLETALVDAEDRVMSQALLCLSSLVEMGLLSRSVLVAPQSVLPTTGIPGKPHRYVVDTLRFTLIHLSHF